MCKWSNIQQNMVQQWHTEAGLLALLVKISKSLKINFWICIFKDILNLDIAKDPRPLEDKQAHNILDLSQCVAVTMRYDIFMFCSLPDPAGVFFCRKAQS
ncbi:hypothetical protein AMECASPLE_035025 [Ameca splendens]|uniref:Uncharacterized protein n=1 Tax=Ameca splendens TaxID=208324 RepID=A0ABV0Z678_9TELE